MKSFTNFTHFITTLSVAVLSLTAGSALSQATDGVSVINMQAVDEDANQTGQSPAESQAVTESQTTGNLAKDADHGIAFTEVDGDSDGQISRNELDSAYETSVGAAETELGQLFNRYDIDSNDNLSEQEYAYFIAELNGLDVRQTGLTSN